MSADYIEKHCLFCNDDSLLKVLYPQTFTEKDLTPEVFSARRTTEHFHYEIVRCSGCGLIFSRRILPDGQLKRLYSESKVTFDDYSRLISKDYMRHIRKYLPDIRKNDALEIGCSSGFFLESLSAAGFERVWGVEPSLEAVDKAPSKLKARIKQDFFREGLFEKESMDLACSFQTLDHLSRPDEALKTVRTVLRKSGYAYFITHDTSSLQAKVLKERSPIIDVEHVYLFDKRSLRRIFEENGFDVLETGRVLNSYPLKYWTRMLSAGRNIDKLLRISRLAEVSIPIPAGNIFVVARKR